MPEATHDRLVRGAAAALLAAGLSLAAVAPAAADAGFRRWISDFESVAAKAGVRHDVYRRVFAGIDDPDPAVIEKARYQPEFNDQVWDYLDNRVNEESIAEGRALRTKLKPWLDRIEARFGVDRDVLLAIWSMETNYGRVLKRDDVVRSVPRSLATLAYLDQRRAKYARTQLIAALKMVQEGDVSPAGLTGSWAGAMGHTQFIPTSYRIYRADMDGNGHADIWTSVPDALATTANLLRKNGWQSGHTWGYEIEIPSDAVARKLRRANKTLAQWAALGFRRPNGKDFPRPSDRANLVLPAGPDGPAFLMTKNFFVLKRYNNADKYALAVGHLADRIGGYGAFENTWPRGYTPLSMEERYELQQRLTHRGLYDGKIDGKIGSGSKSAIMAYQRQYGMPEDGNASKALLDILRSR
ncbi:lytic murein transglycosylase [Mangrovibrevibacter kandeliae]|uniref:lytic murein transglycosylase n=1 Tax=Mangrovibrevibacter kandeliae TaxID=2968473 RepID=UPI0021195122|nr:lytic murein transglycosylase [Aurantimonas sp. CSK15Z-1]MCQ8783278.1 lytic murein transglycosylase [Aurantimonas sp. CSK15Z-1]